MPNYFAHLVFGAKVLAALPEETARPLRAEREAFNLGCLGPDPLFFYWPALPFPARREGMRMHKESVRPVFRRLAGPVRERVPLAGSYAAGFLCHFALDAACHPYVDARMADGHLGHLAMEAELDRKLMEERGLWTQGQAYLPKIRDGAVFRAAALAYRKAGPAQLRQGYAAMRTDTLLFAKRREELLGWMTDKVLRGLPPCRDLRGVILRREPPEEHTAVCRDLTALLQRAVAPAAEHLLEFQAFAAGEGSLSVWFDRDFDGKEHPVI